MIDRKKIMVTGGLGFIGSCFVEKALKRGKHPLQQAANEEADKQYALKSNNMSVATPTKQVSAGDYTP